MHKRNTRYGLCLLLFVSICSGFFYPWFANAEKMPEILVFKESASDVDALYFSADGRYIKSAEYGMITEWDLATGDVSRKYLGKNTMSLFAFEEHVSSFPFEITPDPAYRRQREREIIKGRYRRTSMRADK